MYRATGADANGSILDDHATKFGSIREGLRMIRRTYSPAGEAKKRGASAARGAKKASTSLNKVRRAETVRSGDPGWSGGLAGANRAEAARPDGGAAADV
eukprot:4300964-Pyramimonas_sp.AAC.1